MSRIGKNGDKSRLVVAWGWEDWGCGVCGGGGGGVSLLMSWGIFSSDENALELTVTVTDQS